MKRALFHIFTCVVLALGLTACIDGPDEIDEVIGEGASRLTLGVEFRPMASQLTRTAGNAIKQIEKLHVVVYKEDGTLFGLYPILKFTTEEATSPTNPNTDPANFAESSTCRATFTMNDPIPFGKYRFYVVANYTPDEAQVQSEDALRNISLEWNASDVAKNNAMFGFFTTTAEVPTVNELRGEAPLLTINKAKMSLYAWVRRAASKVTVAFDGTNLYENIYIYIHTVQIKDIPTNCLLGADNTPDAADELIADGEVIYHRAKGSTTQTEGLRVTKGIPTGILYPNGTTAVDNAVVHSETANALYFFENMQGTSDDNDKHQYKNYDSKDNKPYGSYIEVKGYYVNKTAEAASQGPIIYRFMLGKDITTNFDAERNNHYKLTLKFKNNANDPDWHIEYEPESPEISVPSPLYISYGYNEVLYIPVVVRGAKASANTTISAEIIQNPWGYPEHKYYGRSEHEDLNDGFLSFEDTKTTVGISANDRNTKWVGSLTNIKPTNADSDANVYQYSVPVYTRPLILSNSLTGHNPYVSHDRRAKVKFSVVLDGKTYSQVMEVIQVKRLVNPTGVWRSNNNTSPFDVRLMELNEPDANEYGMTNVNFYAPHSDGPWTAHIEEGTDWVQIAPTGSGAWGTADVVGGTGTEIRFDYRPKNTNTTGNVRCGVIRVTYHNNTCVHYVFVSQGNGTVNLAGANWQNRNVLEQNVLVDNPLMEGSMFKFGNPWWGILVENNHREGYGFDISCWGKTFICTHRNTSTGAREYNSFEGIGFNTEAGFTNDGTNDRRIFTNSTTIKPGSYAQWKALETLHRRYGVLYGDECNETKTTTVDAYSYWQVGHERGMQGMFVWDESRNGNHIFFPIGSTGNGHRKVNDNAYLSTYGTIDKYSHLKYAQRPKEMPEATAKVVPMYYDIWLRKGAVYWYDVMYNPAVDFDGLVSNGYGHDINFHSMLLQTYGSNGIGQNDRDGNKSTDAKYIRCVEN